MEAEMQLKQLRRLAQQLEQCERKLSSNIKRLDALCESRCSLPMEKKLHTQSAFLKKQAGLCKDMAAVLEQAVYQYEKAEELIILAAEIDAGRHYKETLRAVSLMETAHIPVTLQNMETDKKISR